MTGDPRNTPSHELPGAGQSLRVPGSLRFPLGPPALGPLPHQVIWRPEPGWGKGQGRIVPGWTRALSRAGGALQGEAGSPCPAPTTGDDTFKADDIGVVKLAHDGRLTQKVPPLSLCVASFEGLDGHGHVPLAWHLQASVADFPRLTCGARAGQVSGSAGALVKLLVPLSLCPAHSLPWAPSLMSPPSQPPRIT